MTDINATGYETIGKIGKGSFGIVYEVKNKETGENCAAKVLNNDDENVNREIETMKKITNPTIIKYVDYIEDSKTGQKVIIMELAKVSLSKVLEEVESGTIPSGFNNTIKQIILIGICYGMKLLYENKIIHRDLKPENILLDDNYQPKIADFGLSKIFQNENSIALSKVVGTPLYMAPEVISGETRDTKSDVFSFSIILYEIITQIKPYLNFKKLNFFELGNKIKDGFRPKFPSQIKQSLKELIEKCWSNDPSQRPHFEDIFYKLAFNQKYYLDDVDGMKIHQYVSNIMKDTDNTKKPLDKLYSEFTSFLDQITYENKYNEKVITSIKNQIKILREKEKEQKELESSFYDNQKKIRFYVKLYQKTILLKSAAAIINNNSDDKIKFESYYEKLRDEYDLSMKELDPKMINTIKDFNMEIDQNRVKKVNELNKKIFELKNKLEKQKATTKNQSSISQIIEEINDTAKQRERILKQKSVFLSDKINELHKILLNTPKGQRKKIEDEITQVGNEYKKSNEESGSKIYFVTQEVNEENEVNKIESSQPESISLIEDIKQIVENTEIPEVIRNIVDKIGKGLENNDDIKIDQIKIDIDRLKAVNNGNLNIKAPESVSDEMPNIPAPSKIIPDLPSKAQFDLLCDRPTSVPKQISKEDLEPYTQTSEDAIQLAKLQNFILKHMNEFKEDEETQLTKHKIKKDPIEVIRERQRGKYKIIEEFD